MRPVGTAADEQSAEGQGLEHQIGGLVGEDVGKQPQGAHRGLAGRAAVQGLEGGAGDHRRAVPGRGQFRLQPGGRRAAACHEVEQGGDGQAGTDLFHRHMRLVVKQMGEQVELFPVARGKTGVPALGGQGLVSARTGHNLDALLSAIGTLLPQTYHTFELLIPYSDQKQVNLVHEEGNVLAEEFTEEGTLIRAQLTPATAGRLREFIRDEATV